MSSVLDRLRALRAADPPTHGGRVLSYVYDSGRPELDRLAEAAAAEFLPVNGLDPTTFGSVAVLERELVRFVREVVGGDGEVVGSATSGGTESCLLAVKSARDRARAARPGLERPVLVMPTTAHPAFRKAVAYLDMELVEVPVGADGAVEAGRLVAAIEQHEPALVVVSAPSYPTGTLDPVADIAAACAARGLDLHVDSCLGGMVLPWWPGEVPTWDFRLPGVTSMSVDLHKYGYAPKGASVVLYRGRERHQAQYFATSGWPGYPVVNPTVLGSRSASALAAAWAITAELGQPGFAELVSRTASATERISTVVAGIEGLDVLGTPTGPLLALTAAGERAVDPFLLVDAVRARGFLLQCQPAFRQPDGTVLPRSAHLTLTPVTLNVVDELADALAAAADEVRGREPAGPDPAIIADVAEHGLPDQLAVVMATLEALPDDQAPALLTQLLADVINPDRA